MKNEIKKLHIIDFTNQGLGISKDNGLVYFVKNGIVGDYVNCIIVKETKNIIYAKAIDIIQKSPYRVKSKCICAKSCGGCQLLEVRYDKQIEIKKNIVFNNLIKIGKIDKKTILDKFVGFEEIENKYYFRNKIQIPFTKRKNKIIYGFYANNSHYIIENNNCLIGFKNSNKILDVIKKYLEITNFSIYDEKNKIGIFREVLLRSSNYNKNLREISVTFIVNDNNYKKNLKTYKKFSNFLLKQKFEDCFIKTIILNINTTNSNVILGNENYILYGDGYIEDSILDVKYQISNNNFYQINMEMTKKLYKSIIDISDVNNQNKVLDLYCGIGTISLLFAKYSKFVLGIEIVDNSIKSALINKKQNQIKNADFLCIDIENMDYDEFKKYKNFFDIICVDPPRKGLNKNVIDKIVELNPKKIIYVSCDSATLARDINMFNEKNFSVKKIKLFDMFPHTLHVESIVLLVNKNE